MNKLQLILAGLAAAATLSLSAVAPASADGAASTRNIILGAAAIAGLAIESNVAHKNAQANAISGYLPDGSAVYADGHVAMRDGYSYYPGNDGQTVACNDGSCSVAVQNGTVSNGPDNGDVSYGGYNGYNANSHAHQNNGNWQRGDNRYDGGRNGNNGQDRDGR
jgi:hypothetical protein